MERDHKTAGLTPQVSPFVAGLKGRCPRCGVGPLFKAPFNLDLRPACESCGLDYRFIDTGDGPAVFAILILGFMMLGGALLLEFTLRPPVWVHMMIWVPVTLIMAFGLLRPLKATLVALQFTNKAAEGRRLDE